MTMQKESYWENLVKRSMCRFLLLAKLAKGQIHGYSLNHAIQDACQGCCEPTETMIYTTLKELREGGYVSCQTEEHQGHQRRVCCLTSTGLASYQAAARIWEKVLPKLTESIDIACRRLSRMVA